MQFSDIQTISPINLTNFELQLTSHLDRRKVDYVLNGLCFGFHLGFQPHLCKLKSAASNCPSANEHPSVIDEYLNKEVSLGRVFGPTHAPPLQNLHVRRFGVIPKKGNAWRLILDLSILVDHSVNDGIDKDDFSFQYCTVKHTINLIIKTSEGALMGKEFHCDNTAVVSVITSGTSKDEQLMHLLRALYLVSTRYNFKVTAKDVPGKSNCLVLLLLPLSRLFCGLKLNFLLKGLVKKKKKSL